MARHSSLAEYYREHREAFTLALELDCTPKEAALTLERRKVQARWEQAERKLQAKMDPAPVARVIAQPEEARQPWWNRD